MASKKSVVKAEPESTALAISDDLPDFLKGQRETNSGLDISDFKTPRLMLLQGLSPQVVSGEFAGKAFPNHFWHNIANENLGTEFLCIVLNITKRAILWRPRHDSGGGLLALSNDLRKWDMGGNQTFVVRPNKDSKQTVEWNTRADVKASGLLNWGTYNPENENSPPAASKVYEYTLFLPEYPNLSPVVLGMSKTALDAARDLNTSILHKTSGSSGVQRQGLVFRCYAKDVEKNTNKWTIPAFQGAGYVNDKAFYEQLTELRAKVSSMEIDVQQDDNSSSDGDLEDIDKPNV